MNSGCWVDPKWVGIIAASTLALRHFAYDHQSMHCLSRLDLSQSPPSSLQACSNVPAANLVRLKGSKDEKLNTSAAVPLSCMLAA